MRINNNISSMHTQGALFMNNRAVGKDLEKLSTGLRINRASDDAAGLAISEGLRTQVRGQQQAKRNALDGISALNIAEGAMNEIHNILQRMRELAVQAANTTYSDTERGYSQLEFTALTAEIERIIENTEFNGITLFCDGDGGDTFFNGNDLQVGANDSGDNQIEVDYGDVTAEGLGVDDLAGVDSQDNAVETIGELDTAIRSLSNSRAQIGALVNRLESTVNNLTTSIVNQQAAESQIRDVDFALQASKFTTNQILTQSATSMLAQANASTQGVLSLLR
jgi:flagellin